MRLFFRVKYQPLITENVPGNCPICKEGNYLQMTICQQYVTWFGIPFFGTSKKEFSLCRKCGAKLWLEFMTPGYAEICKQLKAKTKTPYWVFAGMLIAIVAGIVAAVRYKQL